MRIRSRPTIAAVVLAAGSGSRFGGRKLIATFEGRPLIQRAIDAACGSTALSCTLVLGADADIVLDRADTRRCALVRNKSWREGIASSIRAGLGFAADFDASIFMLADQPFVSSSDIDSLIKAAETGSRVSQVLAPIVALRAGRVWGAPMFFPRHDFHALGQLRGDTGARRYAQTQTRRLRFVPARDARAFCDVDTPADLRALRSSRAG